MDRAVAARVSMEGFAVECFPAAIGFAVPVSIRPVFGPLVGAGLDPANEVFAFAAVRGVPDAGAFAAPVLPTLAFATAVFGTTVFGTAARAAAVFVFVFVLPFTQTPKLVPRRR